MSSSPRISTARSSILLTVLVDLAMAFSLTAGANRSGRLPTLAGRVLTKTTAPHEGAIEAIAAAGVTLGCNPPGNYHVDLNHGPHP
jgi:hypothetical protein